MTSQRIMRCMKRLHRPFGSFMTTNQMNQSLIHHSNLQYFRLHKFCTQTPQINENELLEQLKLQNQDRQKRASPSSDDTKMDDVMQQIRTLHSSRTGSISPELALNACFFITHYHTGKALQLSPENVSEFMKFQETHFNDMRIGWDLLSLPNDENVDGFNTNKSVWKIEMATRMEDSIKINNAFMELYDSQNRDFGNFNDDQLMIAFSTIPYLGRWSLLLELAEIVKIKIPDAFLSLYNMAQSLPIPDFSMIYELVKAKESYFLEHEVITENEKTLSQKLDWRMYEFERIRLRFHKVHCYRSMDDMSTDEQRENMVMNNMDKQMMEWQEIAINQNEEDQGSYLRKMGGICQAKSFYGYGDIDPIQLYGPWVKDGINVKGRVDIPIYNPNGNSQSKYDGGQGMNGINGDSEAADNQEQDVPAIVVIHEEEWDIKQVEEGSAVFEGRYVVRQRNEILDKEKITAESEEIKNFAPMDWVYDLQLTVKC